MKKQKMPILLLLVFLLGCHVEDNLIPNVLADTTVESIQSREIQSCPPSADFPLTLQEVVSATAELDLNEDCPGHSTSNTLLERYYDCIYDLPEFTEDHSCENIVNWPLYYHCSEDLLNGITRYKLFESYNGLDSENEYYFAATGSSPGQAVFSEENVELMTEAAKSMVDIFTANPPFEFDFYDVNFFLTEETCSFFDCPMCQIEVENGVETLVCGNGPTIILSIRFCDIYEGGDDGEG